MRECSCSVMNLSPESLVENPDTVSELTEADITELISHVRSIVENEDSLITVSKGDILAVGDTHGDFEATTYIVNMWKDEGIESLVFLGDYVDRGRQQLENINFLLALKLLHPRKVFILRGNHETPSVNSYYGFSSMCAHAFGEKARRMYNEYNILFSYFSPAFLYKSMLLLHGGIPQGLQTLDEINALPKGDLDADNVILGQILWNDPSEYRTGFVPNWERGIHYTFGEDVFSEFLQTHKLTMVLRAHEVFLEGYKYFFDQTLLSIFSSPNYRMGNKAKVAHISEDGEVTLRDVSTH